MRLVLEIEDAFFAACDTRAGLGAFLDCVRAVVKDHWSGSPEDRPSEQVWARLDAVLFDEEGISRVEPRFEEALHEQ